MGIKFEISQCVVQVLYVFVMTIREVCMRTAFIVGLRSSVGTVIQVVVSYFEQ